jgi:hypothetical protein
MSLMTTGRFSSDLAKNGPRSMVPSETLILKILGLKYPFMGPEPRWGI